jgi:DNA-binding NtrC family response regulator
MLLGVSAGHQSALGMLDRVARSDVEVLITGPTGVGKELYARYVHERSARAEFVPVNCGAIPSQLFENEMFGHVSGAFTGAHPRAQGLVEEAEGGTLLLDEIDTLSLENQVKLLRFIQNREYRRLGETKLRRVNVRVVAASNAELVREVRAGRFRSDLFFRLHVVHLAVPPLRERVEDIDVLVEHFAALYARRYRVAAPVFAPEARARLRKHAWPGNVRELENLIRSLTCQAFDKPITAAMLSFVCEPEHDEHAAPHAPSAPRSFDKDLQTAKRELVDSFERAYLERALMRAGGNIARAARMSGKARRAFFALMRKHGVEAGTFKLSRSLRHAHAANDEAQTERDGEPSTWRRESSAVDAPAGDRRRDEVQRRPSRQPRRSA